jgi:hypothetical protein
MSRVSSGDHDGKTDKAGNVDVDSSAAGPVGTDRPEDLLLNDARVRDHAVDRRRRLSDWRRSGLPLECADRERDSGDGDRKREGPKQGPSGQARFGSLAPAAELEWWYEFYFATERGRLGYEQNRRELAKLISRTASPMWAFDDATFDRSAASFDNADYVDIVIHNYRWRLGLAPGGARFDDLERRLAADPVIAVPTITREGDANGSPHPEPAAYSWKFSGRYEHRTVSGGNRARPAAGSEAFAQAVIDVDRF